MKKREVCTCETRACVCTPSTSAPRCLELSNACLRQHIRRGLLGRAPVPHPPLGPSPGLDGVQPSSTALDSRPTPRERVCSARTARWAWECPGPGNGATGENGLHRAPRGRHSPRWVLWVLGGCATAVDRAPGSSASSPRRHLLSERVLDPRAVVGVGTAIGSNSTPSHRIPLHFQPPTDGAQQGWGWVYAIFLAPACPAACGF